MEHLTGVSTQHILDTRKEGYEPNESSTTRVNRTDYTRSLHSNESRLEAGVYDDEAPSLPGTAVTTGGGVDGGRDRHGIALNQDIALANLDPRARSSRPGPRLGVSSTAVADERAGSTYDDTITVTRDWRLDSE